MGTYTKAQLEAELTRIKNAVADCRTAIVNKGITWCPEDVTLAELPDYVDYLCSYPPVPLKYIGNGPDDGPANPNVYYDTGFTPQLNTKVEIKFSASTIAAGRLFGCGNSTIAAAQYNLNLFATGNTQEGTANTSFKCFYRGKDIAASFTPVPDTEYVVTIYGNYSGNTASAINMTVNGTTYTRAVSITSNITQAQTATIFKWNGSYISIPSGVKVNYVKIWNGNTVAYDFVPYLKWNGSEYVPAFYDRQHYSTWLYNLGTDTPTYKLLF